MKAMLAASAKLAEAEKFLADDAWVLEQKLDGQRVLAISDGTGLHFVNRAGEPKHGVPDRLRQALSVLSIEAVLDGELIGETYFVFDLPRLAGPAELAIHPNTPWADRRRALGILFDAIRPDPLVVRLVPTAHTEVEKRALWAMAQSAGVEGCMAKHSQGGYRQGYRSPSIQKLKFDKEADVVVMNVRDDGKDSARLGLHKPCGNGLQELVEVGRCSLIGKPVVAAGDVITVRYLYATDDDRLYQPRMVAGPRDDKHADECSIDQLVYTDRALVAFTTAVA